MTLKNILIPICLLLVLYSCDLGITQFDDSINTASIAIQDLPKLERVAEEYLFTGSNGGEVAKILHRKLASSSSGKSGAARFQYDLRHEQIWFSDGTNYGFFGDSEIGSDGYPFEKYTDSDGDLRYCDSDGYLFEYDKDIMLNAIIIVSSRWEYNYNLFTNNCQHFTDDVHNEYIRLMNL